MSAQLSRSGMAVRLAMGGFRGPASTIDAAGRAPKDDFLAWLWPGSAAPARGMTPAGAPAGMRSWRLWT